MSGTVSRRSGFSLPPEGPFQPDLELQEPVKNTQEDPTLTPPVAPSNLLSRVWETTSWLFDCFKGKEENEEYEEDCAADCEITQKNSPNFYETQVERIKQEYEEICHADHEITPEKNPHLFTQGCTPADIGEKNRYSDVFPSKATRVELDHNFYYNANWVLKKKAIAAQAPKNKYISDFLKLVFETNVSTIVCLTNPLENGADKCARYWEDTGREVIFSEGKQKIVKRILTLKDKKVVQFHLENWPDHGVVSKTTLAALVKIVDEHLIHNPGKLLVHCTAGLGRTGTFLASYEGLQKIKTRKVPELKKIVTELRGHQTGRPGLVQTDEQYVLAYQTIQELKQAEVSKNLKNSPLQEGEILLLPKGRPSTLPQRNR